MDRDLRGYLFFWFGVVTVVGLTILGSCSVRTNGYNNGYKTVQTLVDKGVDPIAAGCAVWGTGAGDGSSRTDPSCVIAATRGVK